MYGTTILNLRRNTGYTWCCHDCWSCWHTGDL